MSCSDVILAPLNTHVFGFGCDTHDISGLHWVAGYVVQNSSV
jgi:hypothetical protein